ncbi:MAG TPA: TonB-dependent receptor [Puia sp.]|nr:TonB-dependent receptor [Puia sp.]
MSNRLLTPGRSSTVLLSLLLLVFGSLHAQVPQIVGRIVDSATNTGIPRVSVTIKGTKTGTLTDEVGEFRINAAQGSVLVISSQGYAEREVLVSSSNFIVTLTATTQNLADVVVIGYGQKNRRLLTESIGTVSAKDLQKLPVPSGDAAIQGRVSGVQITNADGTPGSPVAVRVRGVGTVGNTQPLFVIDGIPVGNNSGGITDPLSTLNPADIENISVLKDASSAAIYGMRAANGVVLITTKKGRTGAPRVNLDAYYGIQEFPKTLSLNNTQQYVELAQEALTNRNNQDGLAPGDDGYRVLNPQLLASSADNVLGINTDWQTPTINKNAPVNNLNVGVSGGNDFANYFFSAGYFSQQSTTKVGGLQRYSMRMNSDYKIGKRLKLGETVSLSYEKVKKGINGEGDGYLYADDISMPPFFKIYDDEHTIPDNRYGFNGNLGVAGLTIGNQYGINQIIDRNYNTYTLLGGLFAELEIINGLKFRTAASIDFAYGKNTAWQPAYTAEELGLDRNVNNYSDSRSESYTQVFTNTLAYEKTLGKHSFNLLAGMEYQKLRSNGLNYTGYDFQSTSPNFYQSVTNGRGSPTGTYANAGSSLSNEGFDSYFGRLSYNYDDKYLVTATIRRDGTSRFAPENRFGTFPAISAAWRISEEPFMKNSESFISDLKLRASWGQLGNANTSNFAYVSVVSVTPQYPLNDLPLQAPSASSFPNPDVGWETVESTDFGFDISLFNDKVSLLATYYLRNTKNFLYSLPIPYTSGFGSSDVNLGNVRNSGFEFDVSYNTTIARKVHLGISGNLTTVKNRLTALAPGVEEFSADDNYRTAVGYPIGYFYGYKMLGIYQNGDQASKALPDYVSGVAPVPGDIIFQDNNGPAKAGSPAGQQYSGEPDGQIGPEDRTYLGKTIPDFFYGLNITAGYKNFDLSIFFQGVGGVQVYNQARAGLEYLGGPGGNQSTSTLKRWTGEGTSNSMPRAVEGDPYLNGRFSNRWVEDAGFFRFKNIQLGYTLPETLIRNMRAFRSARIYVAATNLFVITKYTGLDPEVMTYGNNSKYDNSNPLGANTDEGVIPQPKTFQAGIQVTF